MFCLLDTNSFLLKHCGKPVCPPSSLSVTFDPAGRGAVPRALEELYSGRRHLGARGPPGGLPRGADGLQEGPGREQAQEGPERGE